MSSTVIQRAIRDVIANMPNPSFPRTTLTADASIGGLSLSINPVLNVNAASRFVPGSSIGWLDGTTERMATVRESGVSSDGTTLQLTTSTGMGFTGLTSAHASGATLYSNVLAYQPFNAQKMLALGDPVFFVEVTRLRTGQWDAMPQVTFPIYFVHIQSNRLLDRPDTSTYDQEMWAEECDVLTKADMEAIRTTLLSNERLTTQYAPGVAFQFGDLHGQSDQIDLTYGPKPTLQGGWHYTGVANAIVTATGESF